MTGWCIPGRPVVSLPEEEPPDRRTGVPGFRGDRGRSSLPAVAGEKACSAFSVRTSPHPESFGPDGRRPS